MNGKPDDFPIQVEILLNSEEKLKAIKLFKAFAEGKHRGDVEAEADSSDSGAVESESEPETGMELDSDSNSAIAETRSKIL